MNWWNTSFDGMSFEEQVEAGLTEDTAEARADYEEHQEWLDMMEDMDPDMPADWD